MILFVTFIEVFFLEASFLETLKTVFFSFLVLGQPPRSPTSPSSFNIPPGYGTIVARSTSLNFKSRTVRPNSASLSIPSSPDQDLEAFLESQFANLDSSSSRTSPNRFSQSATGMGNVPVIGYGGRLPPKKVGNVSSVSSIILNKKM